MSSNKMKLIFPLIAILLVSAINSLFVIHVENTPPGDTRIILENHYQTYIAPPCFEQAEVTNDLTEATLERAVAEGYEPESDCTTEALQPERQSLIETMREKLGTKEGRWDW
jgi:hypothetical protein